LSSCGVPQNFTLFRTSTPELGRFSLVGRNVFDGGMSEIRVSEQSLIIRCQNSRKIILDKRVSAMPDNIDWQRIKDDPTKYITVYPNSIRAKLANLTVNIDTSKLPKCHWWTLF